MAFVLKADASSDLAYVEFDFGSPQTEVWLSFGLSFDNDALDYFNSIGSNDFADILDDGDVYTNFLYLWAGTSPSSWQGAADLSITPNAAANTWQQIELHAKTDGTSEVYIGGSAVISGTAATSDLAKFLLGNANGSLFDAANTVYIRDVKAGTTRGGTDLFEDDFSSGDLSAWSSTYGEVSVVDDPVRTGRVLVAYGSDALTPTPAWTRLDDPAGIQVANHFQTRRGRTYFTDEMQPGTGSFDFYDTDGVMDPTNASSPLYPLNPGCPIQLCLFNPVTENYVPVFTGLVEDCPQSLYYTGAQVNQGTVNASDLMALLARREVPPGLDFVGDDTGDSTPNSDGDTRYAAALVGDRIIAILTDAGVPTDFWRVFSGNVNVQDTVYPAGTSIVTALQDAANAEFPTVANMYVDKFGVFTFHGRLARFDRANWSDRGIKIWNVCDEPNAVGHPSKAVLASLTVNRDINKVINSALYMPQGIDDADRAGQLKADATSIDTYGNFSQTGEYLLTLDGGSDGNDANEETATFGQYFVDAFKDPQTNITQAVFKSLPVTHPNATVHWNMLCNIELNDVLSITTDHPGGGGFLAYECFVEGLSYDVTDIDEGLPNVTLTVDLSPVVYFETAPWENE